ncbi:hypothetical protein [Pseudooceanicola atlanticus]|uniref:hypothetical protein n=1 Tax=Pseudooceanicola atlanticus TaxID=1461694 RepID=UPI0023544220|nr:hypothetical protein [Pseudooceanicola atlanticus]
MAYDLIRINKLNALRDEIALGVERIAYFRKEGDLGAASTEADKVKKLIIDVALADSASVVSRFYYELGYLEKAKGNHKQAALEFDRSAAAAQVDNNIPSEVFGAMHAVQVRYMSEEIDADAAIELTRDLQRRLLEAHDEHKSGVLYLNVEALLLKRLAEYLFDERNHEAVLMHELLMDHRQVEEWRQGGSMHYDLNRYQGLARSAEFGGNHDEAISHYVCFLDIKYLKEKYICPDEQVTPIPLTVVSRDELIRDFVSLARLLRFHRRDKENANKVLNDALSWGGEVIPPLFVRLINDERHLS